MKTVKKVLITGGSGLVGSALRSILKKNKIDCVYLTTSKKRAEENPHAFYWNPESMEIDAKAWENVDSVVHLAGSTINQPWTEKGKRDIIDSRVNSTKTLVHGLKNQPNSVVRVVAASAIGWYANEQENWQYENDAPGNGFLSDAVIRWEEELQTLEPFNLAIVRVGVVLSTKGGALPTIALPVKLGIGSPIGSGQQFMPWVHIDDLCGIFQFLLDNQSLTGIYNGVAPEAINNREFTKTLAKVLGRPFFFPAVPSFVLRIALGERADMVLRSNKVSAEKISKAGYRFLFPKTVEALEHLYEKT
ncbi:MAG: TIGR01777 family protein [Flavobacteriales bacterium]|nr:MAG: TIGR01777 family protein [Flavobacteriales bacterium]